MSPIYHPLCSIINDSTTIDLWLLWIITFWLTFFMKQKLDWNCFTGFSLGSLVFLNYLCCSLCDFIFFSVTEDTFWTSGRFFLLMYENNLPTSISFCYCYLLAPFTKCIFMALYVNFEILVIHKYNTIQYLPKS